MEKAFSSYRASGVAVGANKTKNLVTVLHASMLEIIEVHWVAFYELSFCRLGRLNACDLRYWKHETVGLF